MEKAPDSLNLVVFPLSPNLQFSSIPAHFLRNLFVYGAKERLICKGVFQGRYNTEYGPLMAAAALAAIPVTIVF